MSDEKGKNSGSADDLAEKLFGINVRKSTDAEVGDGLLFDDYDGSDNSIDALLGLGAKASPKVADAKEVDFDFDRAEQRESKSSTVDYADEIDDDLILFTDDEDENQNNDVTEEDDEEMAVDDDLEFEDDEEELDDDDVESDDDEFEDDDDDLDDEDEEEDDDFEDDDDEIEFDED